jgi:arginyl-tRNA synthetase
VKSLPHAHIQLITDAIVTAQKNGSLPAFDIPTIPLQVSKKAGQGDYNSPIALSLTKLSGMKPRDIAETIVKHLPQTDFVEKVEIAGAGFINFFLSGSFLRQQVNHLLQDGGNYLNLEIGKGKHIQVEFVSANPTGPITIGHTRNAVVGDAMARMFEAAGYAVQREYYFNNAGNQMFIMGNSLQARYLEQLGLPFEFPEGGYKGEYIVDYAKKLVSEVGDSYKNQEWQVFKDYAEKQMFDWINSTLKRIDIQHDNFFNENSLFETEVAWQTLAQLRDNGYIYEAKDPETVSEDKKTNTKDKEVATWFRTSKFGDENDRVMVKGDGSATYTLPDIAYHKNKLERNFDLCINVLGADHQHQAKVVVWGIEALGMDPSKIHVIFIQMVKTVRDGKELKISKRAGVFDTLDDLIDMTSADAVRYHILARSPDSQLTFDVDAVVKQSNDNPVYYIQNAHVRCAGILREAEARGLTDEGADLSLLGEDELSFIRKLLEVGEVIETAVLQYQPHAIAFFAYELASVFHPVYERVRAMGEDVTPEQSKARLRFYKASQIAFKHILGLMGMSAPDRM